MARSISSAQVAGRRQRPAAVKARPARAAQRVSTSILLPLFIISLAIPVYFYAGPLRLSPYRALLLALFIPCVLAWMSGQLGKIRLPDVLILLSALWGMLALTVNHGLSVAWEPAGILLIETFGSYLLARKLIRNERDFRTMVRVVFWMLIVLLPFAIVESLTGRAILIEVLDRLATAVGKTDMGLRHGFYRAQVVFEHPILYGVFASSGLGLVYYVLGSGPSFFGRWPRTSIVAFATLLSLSAGALASLVAQFGFAAWDHMTRSVPSRWKVLALLAVAAYVSIDLLSNRTPFHVFVTYLTFSPETGYSRIMIFEWGSAEVMRHPIFGIGLNDWGRPSWKSGSMDNFWLVVAVIYGLPAFVFLAGAVALIIRSLGRLKLEDEQIRACRAGLLVTLGGLIIAGATVHYWNAIYVWFIFLIGSGIWILEPREVHVAKQRSSEANRLTRLSPRVALGKAPRLRDR